MILSSISSWLYSWLRSIVVIRVYVVLVGVRSSQIVSCSGGLRWQVLEKVDKELNKGNERSALYVVKDVQGKLDGLRCFGAACLVPQRLYTLDELKLNGIETSFLLSPVDTRLGAIERNL
ncbi:hypothetical protein POM88_049906 [Heracleum sosnowskyi]|uniref:Uncharacterized protein n=1 Tax=Heracleum sosnowskyi TaxID=360622 RepID=A0AAD8GZ34_9APIA|nr:hypothetical protein POM88_049906 [Heracleum sosnowskyi]